MVFKFKMGKPIHKRNRNLSFDTTIALKIYPPPSNTTNVTNYFISIGVCYGPCIGETERTM